VSCPATRRTCQFERDWSAVRLDDDAETEEATALSLGFNRLRDVAEQIVGRRELQSVAEWELLVALCAFQQIRE
jgi:hypothetical protein